MPVADAPAQLLTVQDLKVHFPIRAGVFQRQVGAVKAVDGVSFSSTRAKPWPRRRSRLWQVDDRPGIDGRSFR